MDIANIYNYQKLEFSITAIAEQIQQLRERLESVSPVLSDMPQARNISDKTGDLVTSIIYLESVMLQKIKLKQSVLNEIFEQLENLSEVEYKVLYYRYIKGMKWYEVADETNYNVSYVRELAKKTIAKLNQSC